MVSPSTTRMTAAEFFELPETVQPIELLDGKVIVSPAPVPVHQRIILRLALLLNSLIPDGELFLSPIDLALDDSNVVQPDLVWLSVNGECRVLEKRLEGAPELVVEVFSPGSVSRDKRDKFQLYQRHGIAEYWMVDPSEDYLEVYSLEGKRYVRLGVYVDADGFMSPALGRDMTLVGIFADAQSDLTS